MPTLEVGDRVLVNKLSYDLHDLHRGDIVVFAAEPNRRVAPRRHRRPGEARDRAARARPSPSARPTASASTASCSTRATCPRAPSPRCRPTLPYITDASGKKVLVCDADSPEGGCKVPAGKVFVMGDNRTNSSGRARQRPDQGVEHRRPRVPAHLAAGPHRLHVAVGCWSAHTVNSPTVATMRATWSE